MIPVSKRLACRLLKHWHWACVLTSIVMLVILYQHRAGLEQIHYSILAAVCFLLCMGVFLWLSHSEISALLDEILHESQEDEDGNNP